MPKPIQGPDLSAALVKANDLQGKLTLLLDEVVVPVSIAQDLTGATKSPFRKPLPVGMSLAQGAGGAGVFSMAGIRPAAGTVIVVEQCEILNSSGGVFGAEVRFLTAAQFGAITVGFSGPIPAFNRLQPSGGGIPRGMATQFRATNAGAIGTIMTQYRLRQDETFSADFPGGIALYGDDPQGAPAVVVSAAGANSPVAVDFYATEYLIRAP